MCISTTRKTTKPTLGVLDPGDTDIRVWGEGDAVLKTPYALSFKKKQDKKEAFRQDETWRKRKKEEKHDGTGENK